MFGKNKKKKEDLTVPKPKETPEPQEIEEMAEGEETPEVPEEKTPKKKGVSTEVEEEGELTEEKVLAYFEDISRILHSLTERIAKIEYHLRLDF